MSATVPRSLSIMLFLGAALTSGEMKEGPKVRVSDLRCEYLRAPLGVDVPRPRLSWTVRSAVRGEETAAYRVQVATARVLLEGGTPDLWDTGRVEAHNVFLVPYSGTPLRSSLRCWWRVKVWGTRGGESAWSDISFWEMGLCNPSDWVAKWISDGKPLPRRDEDFYKPDPAPLLRTHFTLQKEVAKARLYITGLGYYEAYINGTRVGDHVLDPLWTTYSKRIYWSAYDVTRLLTRGENVLGATLGNGWYNPLPLRMWGRINLRNALPVGRPRLLAQLHIWYKDGTRRILSSDETWRTREGPLLRNNVYLGEVYDARCEIPGWNEPGFDDSGWKHVKVVPAPGGRLKWQAAPPIRVIERIMPRAVTEPKPGVFIFDFARNFAGWIQLKVKGRRGTKVRLRYGELLYPDGTLNVMTSVCGQIKRSGVGGPGAPPVAYQSDTYFLKGGGTEEVYTPRFTFHGFRYVEVTGYPGRPDRNAIEGLALSCDLTPAGRFSCSDPLLNRIHTMVLNTFRSNLLGVQSDCPHREKFGYGGDIVASRHALLFSFDISRFYAKVVRDFQDAARPNGGLTETAPYVGIAAGGFGGGSGPIGWAIAHPLLLEDLYRFYGDRRIVHAQYGVAKRWFDFLRSKVPGFIVRRGISDHESVVPKPVPVTGTAFYAQAARTLASLARIAGRENEAEELKKFSEEAAAAFRKSFFNAENGSVFTGTQTCQATALYHDLIEPPKRPAVLSALAERITADGGKITCGIFGTKYLLEVLSRYGTAEAAYRIVTQEECPGWVYMLKRGATTLWEHWRFSDNVFSHNHPMFGSVSEWFYRHLAGINPAKEAVAFNKVEIRPDIVGTLTWVEATYRSVRGPLSVRWERRDGRVSLQVHIPVGVTGKVFLPVRGPGAVTEGGRPCEKAPGVALLERKENCLIVKIGAGRYRFQFPFAK